MVSSHSAGQSQSAPSIRSSAAGSGIDSFGLRALREAANSVQFFNTSNRIFHNGCGILVSLDRHCSCSSLQELFLPRKEEKSGK